MAINPDDERTRKEPKSDGHIEVSRRIKYPTRKILILKRNAPSHLAPASTPIPISPKIASTLE
jgi:hypothetical protein